MSIIEIIHILDEIFQEPITSYVQNFYSDIAAYIDIDYLLICKDTDEIKEFLSELIKDNNKYKSLLNCKTKNDVREWLNNITSYIIGNIKEQELIHEYLN